MAQNFRGRTRYRHRLHHLDALDGLGPRVLVIYNEISSLSLASRPGYTLHHHYEEGLVGSADNLADRAIA